MKTLITLLLCSCLVAPVANARKSKRACVNTKVLLDEVALNGAAGTRTFTVQGLGGFDVVSLHSQFTHANNGTLTYTCTFQSPKPTDYTPSMASQFNSVPTTCTMASGACTLNIVGTWATASLSTDTNFSFPVGIAGESSMTCVVAHGGTPAAGDIITVVGRKCTGG